jgi:2-polyprenyl-3-methyl-5-hydroxy-6-metoxy-1,4-benzoquinol methylase
MKSRKKENTLNDERKNAKNLVNFPLFSGVVHAEKYQSGNRIANKLVANFLRSIVGTVQEADNKDVHEVGCGEGHILGALASAGFSVRGCDISKTSLEVARNEAKRHGFVIPIEEKSIYELDLVVDVADTVVCCEVLEHLTDPDKALSNLLSITRKDLILSVPNEPLWHLLNMVRGKYWNALGNTPGHYQHWTSRSFVEFVAARAEIVTVKKPLPWTLVHCRPKGGRSK